MSELPAKFNAQSEDLARLMESAIVSGDLKTMTPGQKVQYYLRTCESLGMNPMSKPFDLITLNSKMVLYPNRSGTDQLRKIGNVSLTIVDRKKEGDLYIVTAQATMPNGRTDESTGAVTLNGLRGDALANALMKAETKAKRRVTLSIMGLGWVEESEVSSIKGAQLHKMDLDTGAITDEKPESSPAFAKATIPAISPMPTPPSGQCFPVDLETKKKLGQQIKTLKTELELSDEEMKAEAYRLFQQEDFKLMTVANLEELLAVLQEEKELRSKDSLPPLDTSPQPWMEGTTGPLPGAS